MFSIPHTFQIPKKYENIFLTVLLIFVGNSYVQGQNNNVFNLSRIEIDSLFPCWIALDVYR